MQRVISSLSDLIGIGAAGQDLAALSNGAGFNAAEVIRLSRAGILPDTGGDLTTAIQAVIDANPGKDILFDRAGTYLVNTVTTNTLSWCLSVTHDNTHFLGVPGALLKTTQNAAVVFFAGPARNGAGFTSWAANRFYVRLTVYGLSGSYAAGATSITLTTAADAGNFAAGDLIFIRTGQLVDALNDQPDAETNEVLTANAGTGVITLRYPLTKPYAQEYYVSGTIGLTSTSATANLAPYGVSKVTDYTLKNVGIRGLDFESAGNPWHAYQCWRFEITDAEITAGASNGNPYFLRWFAFRRLRVRLTAATNAIWFIPLGATGQTNGVAEDIEGSCPAGVGFLHMHEGGASLTAQRLRLRNGGAQASTNIVQILSRGYNLKVLDSFFWQSGSAAAVQANDTVTGGLIFDGNEIYAETGDAVSFGGANQKYGRNNRILKGALALWVGATGFAVVGGHAPTEVEIMSQWVSDDNQNPALGTLPANCYLLDARLHVQQAFNSDGTDLVRCGYDAADTSVFADVDVSTTGLKAITLGALSGYNATARDLEIYYANSGTEPTTGRALVIVEFARCAKQVT